MINTKLKVDRTLTPQSALEKGFVWKKDSIYSPVAPSLLQEIVDLVKKGYRLGQPNASSNSDIFVGLYKPKAT